MSQSIIGYCPVCSEELFATRLTCLHCGLELSNQFSLNKFSYLSEDDLYFLDTFLMYSGNFKEVQNHLHLTYPAFKKRLICIQQKLGYKSPDHAPSPPDIIFTNLPIYQDESSAVRAIKEKLNQSGGLVSLPLTRGTHFHIYYEEFGNGLHATNLPAKFTIPWAAFDAAVRLLYQKGGQAKKGNAMKFRLGEEGLTLDTIEGYVASAVFHGKTGSSVLRIITPLSAILEWAGICQNGYGYLKLL